jgi:L-alanine-DL-glutamate epimerase-like enolase superfamily enzyme
MSRTTIRSVSVEPLNIPLLEPFTIATGSVSDAQNVLITITLNDGSTGYGECAPFTPSTDETQETALITMCVTTVRSGPIQGSLRSRPWDSSAATATAGKIVSPKPAITHCLTASILLNSSVVAG